jgi:membrane protease YdiL (CAAX protease family)
VSARSDAGARHPAGALTLLLLTAPYFLNKLIYIAFPGYWVFVATDYLDRLVTLSVLYLVVRRTSVGWPVPWCLTWPGARDALAIALATAGLIVADILTWHAVQWLNDRGGRLTRYPAPPDPLAAAVDDSFGMLLIGFSEEAIFRFYLINALLLRGRSRAAAVILSSAVFAAIHWSYGLGSVLFAGGAGLLLAAVFLTTRSLTAPMLIHALYDTADFAGLTTALRHWLFG